ncbi:MAG TPA: sensor domain-containing diguanylate cyclase [Rugosimonospora sp.]|nr:sensor domain-containing diguanylate cyclase [Rugosimonospora sp.]
MAHRPIARDPVLLAQIAAAVLGSVWYLVGGAGPVPFWSIVLASDVLFVVLCHRVAVLGGPEAPLVRRFWRAMTGGGCLFTIGDLTQVAAVVHDPRAGPVGTTQSSLVAAGVLCIISAMLTHPLGGQGTERKRLWLDAGTVMTSVAVFAWYFLVSGTLGRPGSASVVAAVTGSAVMLMAAFGLLKLILSGTAPFTLPAAVVGGTSALVIGLLTALTPVLPDTGYHGLLLVIRMLPSVLFAATPRVQEIQMRTRPDALAPRPRQPYSRLPYLAVGATQALLIQDMLRHGHGPATWGAMFGAAAITALVLTRQLLAFHDNARLVTTLDDSLLRLRRQEERFRSLVQHASDITVVAAEDGTIGYASPALERVLGFPPPYRSAGSLVEQVHRDDQDAYRTLHPRLMSRPGASVSIQLRVRHLDGSWRWLDVIAVNLLHDPSVGGVVYNARDVTEARQLQDRLQYEATHDALTRLANRALFDERVRAVDELGGERLAILVIDLDDFKKINDSYGHAVGDGLLVAVADRLRSCVRPTDTVARLGGDEFAVLLPGAAPEQACALADRMALALAVPVGVEGFQLAVGASIGVASGGREQAERLLRDADAAMYAVKHGGKGGYSVTSPAIWEQMSAPD